MATVKKFGEAVVITSSAKLEDIRKIAKYRPEALVLCDEETKEPLFCVGLSDNRAGSISKYGIEFGGSDACGNAQVTMAYAGPNGDDGDVKAAIADSIGAGIAMLSKLETSFPAVLEQIAGEVAAILASIEVG